MWTIALGGAGPLDLRATPWSRLGRRAVPAQAKVWGPTSIHKNCGTGLVCFGCALASDQTAASLCCPFSFCHLHYLRKQARPEWTCAIVATANCPLPYFSFANGKRIHQRSFPRVASTSTSGLGSLPVLLMVAVAVYAWPSTLYAKVPLNSPLSE